MGAPAPGFVVLPGWRGYKRAIDRKDTTMQPMRRAASDDTRAKLFALIKARSFSRRSIALVSGRTSNYYFDMKPTMFDPAGAAWTAELMLDQLVALKVDYVGGLAIGAVPLVASIIMLSHQRGRPIPGFFVRAQVKDHGTQRRIEGTSESLNGKNVVIVEDVTTTGGSATTALEVAIAEGANVVLVLSVVDRLEGAGDHFKARGVPFRAIYTSDEFLAD
jgi:orotate phosphoribosyltransferase